MRQRSSPLLQPLLNERDVATLLGVSVRTLQEWRQSGHGPPFVKLSGKKRGVVRYDPVDVRSYVLERRVRSTAEDVELPDEELADTRVRRR